MGCVLVLDNLISFSFTIDRFMVHGAVFGRMVSCIIWSLILISLWKFGILRLRGLIALASFFVFYFQDAIIGRILGA